MARPDYVPRTHSGFNRWQRSIAQFVNDNATAWAIDSAKVAELNDKSTQFTLLYKAIENPNVRTLQQVAEFNQFRIAYTSFLRQLVQSQLVNSELVSYADKIAMGLNPRSGSRSSRPKITSMPVIEITNLGGGEMEFVCIDSSDGRSKRPDNADGVELQLVINMSKATDMDSGEVIEVTDKLTLRSSKTRVNHTFTDLQRGKSFSVRGRWYNNTNPQKDGNFGSLVSSFVG